MQQLIIIAQVAAKNHFPPPCSPDFLLLRRKELMHGNCRLRYILEAAGER
jgi:hypothetical protein